MSDASIPWLQYLSGMHRVPIVCRGLLKAVRRMSLSSEDYSGRLMSRLDIANGYPTARSFTER
jgi:hypothetical protein